MNFKRMLLLVKLIKYLLWRRSQIQSSTTSPGDTSPERRPKSACGRRRNARANFATAATTRDNGTQINRGNRDAPRTLSSDRRQESPHTRSKSAEGDQHRSKKHKSLSLSTERLQTPRDIRNQRSQSTGRQEGLLDPSFESTPVKRSQSVQRDSNVQCYLTPTHAPIDQHDLSTQRDPRVFLDPNALRDPNFKDEQTNVFDQTVQQDLTSKQTTLDGQTTYAGDKVDPEVQVNTDIPPIAHSDEIIIDVKMKLEEAPNDSGIVVMSEGAKKGRELMIVPGDQKEPVTQINQAGQIDPSNPSDSGDWSSSSDSSSNSKATPSKHGDKKRDKGKKSEKGKKSDKSKKSDKGKKTDKGKKSNKGKKDDDNKGKKAQEKKRSEDEEY